MMSQLVSRPWRFLSRHQTLVWAQGCMTLPQQASFIVHLKLSLVSSVDTCDEQITRHTNIIPDGVECSFAMVCQCSMPANCTESLASIATWLNCLSETSMQHQLISSSILDFIQLIDTAPWQTARCLHVHMLLKLYINGLKRLYTYSVLWWFPCTTDGYILKFLWCL